MEADTIAGAAAVALVILGVWACMRRRSPPDCEGADYSPANYPPPRPRLTRPRPERTDVVNLDWVLLRDDWVVLDLETTGYTDSSEIIEIAIVAADGTALMNERVLPKGRMPRSAVAVHGITRKMLEGCPRWPDIEAAVREHLSGRPVVTYNTEFEERLLRQTSTKWSLPPFTINGRCAMLAYAAHRGIRDDRRSGFKWHKLTDACEYEGIAIAERHQALADAHLTRELVLKMAADNKGQQAA